MNKIRESLQQPKAYVMLLAFLCLISNFHLAKGQMLQASLYPHQLSQKVTIRMESVKVTDVLQEIENQSNYVFIYSHSSVDKDKIVSVDAENQTIEEILDRILRPIQLDFTVLGNQIILKTRQSVKMLQQKELKEGSQQEKSLKQKLLLPSVSVLSSLKERIQEQIITGKVTDANTNEPLPGVNVIVKGTSIGTVTDVEGNYSINVPEEGDILLFSSIGYTTQEITVGTERVINITMAEDVHRLEELVVVGYSVQKKMNVTGSVSTIDSEEIVKVPSPNISGILTGKAPGLLTQQTQGVPGNDVTSISIRGYDSPLVLVDGIQMDWERIDPNEIESISVLKDASAAIYGSRAGNGVILITTKRGSTGEPTITYNSNLSFQEPTILPDFVDSWQFAELLREGEFNQQLPFTYTEEEVQIFKEGDNPDYPNTDWHEEMFRHWAPMHTHNLSVRGGMEKIKYFISLGYLDQASVYESGDLNFNRYNARSNIDAQITNNLTASIDLAFRRELRDQPETRLSDNWTDLNVARPDFPAHIPDPELGAAYAGFNVRSPLAQTFKKYTGFVDDRRDYLTGNINLNYKIPGIEGLEANAKLNYLSRNSYKKTQDKPFEVLRYNYDTETYNSFGINGQNTLNEELGRYTQLYPILSLGYERTFGNHSINGLLLSEWIDSEQIYFTAGKIDLLSLDLPYLYAGSPENVTADGYTVETGRSSYAGRVNYSYKDRYLLEGTFRYDASHKFPSDSRWGFFPSVSAGWIFSNESFMQNLSWIDHLKLRTSYSKAGDDNVEAFKYVTGYRIRTGRDIFSGNELYLFGNEAYRMITPTGLPNEGITWLDMTSYNIGLDGSFHSGLIGFEFDVFYRSVDNVFGEPLDVYPSTFGAILPQLNINSTDDRGFELMLTHRNRISDDLSYTVNANFSYARQKYVKWAENPFDDPDEIRVFQRTGNYTNRRVGFVSDGIFMNQNEIENHPVDQDEVENTTLRPGDIKYKDLNGDGILNWRDQDEIGLGSFPDVVYSLNFSLRYQGLSFSALFQGASMFDHYNEIHPLVNFGKPWDFHYKYRWQPDPDNPDVNINPEARLPAVLGDGVGRSPNNEKFSDFWIQDATYLRLRELNISYSLPERWVQGIGLKGMVVSLAGGNLFTISKLGIYKNSIDPEGVGGGASRLYPPVKTISAGINVTL